MLTLYSSSECPFCQRILQIAENLKIELNVKDITEDETIKSELFEKEGKDQVPYLVDDEKEVALLESSDIIDYIRENYANTSKNIVSAKSKVHVGGSVCESCEG